MNYQEINAKIVDQWNNDGWIWGKAISHEDYLNAQKGQWEIHLTPVKMVPREWLGDLKGKKVLGLACGGAQQMPILTACGAKCTVVDYSDSQLDKEYEVSKREGYEITIVKHDMTKTLPFKDEAFDLIIHPVSNCYIEKVEPVFKECYRVLKPGGVLLSGLDTGINYIVDEKEEQIINHLPFNPLVDKEQLKQLQETNSGIQFSHTVSEQISGQLKEGFQLTDIDEDTNGVGRLHKLNIASYIMTRAIKP